MQNRKVYVVTSLEAGWDCIVDVFDASEVMLEELLLAFPKHAGYSILIRKVETSLDNWYADEN